MAASADDIALFDAISPALALGPWLLGSLLSMMFFGAFLLQTIAFVSRTKRKSAPMSDRILVGVALLCSLMQTSTLIATIWRMFIGEADDRYAIANNHNLAIAAMMVSEVVTLSTSQVFFGRRCYRLWGSRRWLGLLIAVCILFCFATGLAFAIRGGIMRRAPGLDYQEGLRMLRFVFTITFLGWAAFDVALSVAIAVRLIGWQQGFRRDTDTLLAQTARLALTTAGTTSIVAVAIAILTLITNPRASLAIPALVILLPRIAASSMLYTINANPSNRADGATYDDTPQRRASTRVDLPGTLRPSRPTHTKSGSHTGSFAHSIHVDIERIEVIEEEADDEKELKERATRFPVI